MKEWLDKDPKWGWGWIDWSDYYLNGYFGKKDYERAEEILKKALKIPGIRDKEIVLERLESIYSDTNRRQEASEVKKKSDSLGRQYNW